MKKNVFKGLLLLLCCSFLHTGAQSPMEDVVAGLRVNKVQAVGRYIDNIVLITINNTEAAYSSIQAELVLKDFLGKNQPKDFVIVNSGSPDTGSKFVIGNLLTTSGNYSVYILMKQKAGGSYILQEIRLNRQ